MPQFHVRIDRADQVFSAAHFITFADRCEPLHGHDFRVVAEVHGPLDENQYVVDFLALREELGKILAGLDHAVLLPTEHPDMSLTVSEREVEVTWADHRWVFPRGDCRLLPLANTTAELLARHIGRQLRASLKERTGRDPQRIIVEVEESPGQRAVWAETRTGEDQP
ncbi:MAG: 6-carboxytetrahydropterin synthase [Thermoguttaceae bacterium]|jgi:6-pyruvoyltetrahydropterin/6-carboxytetrahydropterin synthase